MLETCGCHKVCVGGCVWTHVGGSLVLSQEEEERRKEEERSY